MSSIMACGSSLSPNSHVLGMFSDQLKISAPSFFSNTGMIIIYIEKIKEVLISKRDSLRFHVIASHGSESPGFANNVFNYSFVFSFHGLVGFK